MKYQMGALYKSINEKLFQANLNLYIITEKTSDKGFATSLKKISGAEL